MELANKNYEIWRTDNYFDAKTREELEGIMDNTDEINERFYKL